MAKSTRSKVKRAFRAKKRTDGVFAAAEAARLQRLNAKLRALTTATIPTGGKGDGGREGVNAKQPQDEEELQDVDMAGSCWFTAFGLLDHQEISPAILDSLGFGF
jgi:hypothetical protein